MPRNLNRLLPYLPFLAAVLVLAAPLLLTGKALYWGTPGLQFVPWREAAFDAIRGGRIPLWNPLVGMGAPLLANYQSAIAYPPTWLLFILSSLGGIAWHAWGQMLLVALHWIIAGIGMVLLARRLGLGTLSQALSGLAYGLGAYLVSRAGFLSINAAAAWLPWIVYYAGQLASPRMRQGRPKWSVFVMLTLVAALQLLSGHAQTAWYTLILAFVWCGYWAWMDADGFGSSQVRQNHVVSHMRSVLGAWLFVGASYLLAAALAAIQLIPTAEYLLQSQRQAAVDYELAMTYSLWPWRLLTLLAPSLFGSPVNGDYWGYANYWEDALYIGLFPVLLAMIALVRWLVIRRNPNEPAIPGTQLDPGPRWEAVPLLLVLTGVSLLLAMGRNTPVFPWLYRHVPTFDMFQAPARFSLWAAFSLPLLAGFGAHSLRRPEKRSLYWTRLGTAGAAAVTIGAGIAWIAMGEVSPTFLRATALAGLLGVIVGILCLIAPPRGKPEAIGLWHWSVVAFVAVDLVLAGWMLNPGVSTEFYSRRNDEVESVSKILAGRRLYLSSDDENDLKFKRFFLFSSFESGEDPFQMRRVFLPNLNMLDGIPIVNNFDPLLPGSYAVWVKALNEAQGADLEKLLDLSGVGAVESIDPSSPDGVRFSPLPAEKGKRVRLIQCENQGAENNPISQIEYLLSDAFDPGREILLEGDSGETFTCLGDGSPGKVTPVEELPDRLVYQVQQSSPGWLLLSDSWYPGWQATVDGESRPILRANTLFRAVAIRPGDREVIFEYKPMSLWAGVLISLLAGLSLISFVYVKKREKARKATSPLGLSFPERAEQQ